jgi:hypothetical protein
MTRERIEDFKKESMQKQLENLMMKHHQDRIELEEEEMKYLSEL